MPPYPPFRAPIKRGESTAPISSEPPPRVGRASQTNEGRQTQPGDVEPDLARLDERVRVLARELKEANRRLDQVEKAEADSSVRELLREAESAKAKLEREKAAAEEQKRVDASASAVLARALAKEAAWRSFKFAILASLVSIGLTLLATHLLK